MNHDPNPPQNVNPQNMDSSNGDPSNGDPSNGDPAPHATPPKAAPRRRFGRVVLIGALAAVAAWLWLGSSPGDAPAAGEPGHIAWRSDFAAATADAGESGRPALLFFTADWCGPCQQLKADVLWRPDVAEAIDVGAVPIKVDLTDPDEQQQALAARFGVRSIPTLVLLSSDGREIRRVTGWVAPDDLKTWLAPTTAAATATPTAPTAPIALTPSL